MPNGLRRPGIGPFRMKKILIVEDDQLVATAYRKRFQEAGYEVEWAPDGLEGIKMVSGVKPDVVLLDLLMPRLDGIEVLKYIRSHNDLKNLPVVVFSNSYMTNLVESAWRAGADQCLMKASTTPAQLFDVVNKAIQKAAARKAAAVNAPLTRAQAAVPVPAFLAPPAPVPALAPPLATSSATVQPLARPAGILAPPVSPIVAARSAPPPVPGGPPAQREVDPEFQEQIRQLFLKTAPGKMSSVGEAARAFIEDQGSSMQIPLLNDLFRQVHSLTGNAAVAGCARVAGYASMFEAFLQELQQKPKFINASTANSVAQAVGFLDVLLQRAPQSGPARVLVVDGDAMSGQAIGMAVEKAEYEATLSNDPVPALSLLVPTTFDAVVVAVDLPTLSGFEFCAQMQGLPSCVRTPVVFVTDLDDFRSHAQREVLGENDLIARPFLLIEMTLKVVTCVERSRLAA